MELIEFGGLVGILIVLLVIDVHFFAPGREATFRESVSWSLGWLALGLAVTFPVLAINGSEHAVNYVTVYLIERSLSLDNLFVFILLFAYFGVPQQLRPRLLFWGIIAALVLRGLAILGGTTLIEQFHFVLYVLGVLLLVLAYRIARGAGDEVDPDRNVVVRAVRRIFPVTDGFREGHWFVRQNGARHVTPAFLCLTAIVAADIAFAVDSIPAAFAITTDPLVIWMANVFALVGMRALFVLVEGLIRRFRYLDQTIAVVLALIAVKLLIEPVVKVGPVASLALVAAAFAIGIAASLLGDRRDPEGAEERRAANGAPAPAGPSEP
jgi:tellurite resistance protein TerC